MASRYVYWPKGSEYAIPWSVGPLIFLLLGAFDLPSGKPASLGSVPSNLGGYTLAMLLLLGLNALFLWTHMRGQFLTWSTGRKRFWGTYLLLTIGHLLVWGIVLLLRGHARFALLSDVDWSYTFENVDFALLGFTIVLLATAVWKTEEPGLSTLRLEREAARRLIAKLKNGTISSEEFQDLEPTLRQLKESARPLAARLSGPDLELLRAWRVGGEELLPQIQGQDYNNVGIIRKNAHTQIDRAMNALARAW